MVNSLIALMRGLKEYCSRDFCSVQSIDFWRCWFVLDWVSILCWLGNDSTMIVSQSCITHLPLIFRLLVQGRCKPSVESYFYMNFAEVQPVLALWFIRITAQSYNIAHRWIPDLSWFVRFRPYLYLFVRISIFLELSLSSFAREFKRKLYSLRSWS